MTAEEKKKISELHAKYYSGKKKTKEPKVPAKTPKEPKAKGPSRNSLMLEAKSKNIRNFRILTKEELTKVLEAGVSKERINEIVAGAVTRWKASWGKDKHKEKTQK